MIEISLVDDEAIDTLHQEEVNLLTHLLDLLKTAQNVDAITNSFEALISHMKEHFFYEESLMQGKGYAMYTIHQTEHYKVLNEANYRMMLWTSSKDTWDLEEYLRDDLLVWYTQHIDAMDKPLVDFLKGNK